MKNIIENLPRSAEAERIILGSIISESECLEEIKPILKPEHFSETAHQILYTVILELEKEGKPIDQPVVYERLKADQILDKIGGITFITKLAEDHTSSATVGYHSKIIFEKFLKRQLINTSLNIIQRAGKREDVFDLLSEAEKEIGKINSEFNFVAEDEKPFTERLDEIFSNLQARSKGEKEIEALKLKTLPTLNKIIGGIMPTDLIGIYGKEKSTKSSLAHEIALDLGADQKIPVCIFTFEHSQEEADWKSISMRTGIEFNKLRNPQGYSNSTRLTGEEIEVLERETYQKFKDSKIIICDKILDEYQIGNKLRLWKKKHGIKLCVIDYLMLINSIENFSNRREELNHLSRFFKRLSMKLQIPIILISQSNDAGERAAEAKGLERDSNYFIYVKEGEEHDQVHFNVAGYGKYTYSLSSNEFVATVRGIRHASGNKSFITKFVNNRYVEVDARPPALKNSPKQKENWYERKEDFPI